MEIGDVLIGIESQGDSNSRQSKSLLEFAKMGCTIILCACRSRGTTKQNVVKLRKSSYSIIWAPNVRPEKSLAFCRDQWNNIYAENMVKFIEDYSLGKNDERIVVI